MYYLPVREDCHVGAKRGANKMALVSQAYEARWLEDIGVVFFLLNLVLFILNCILITMRFIS